MKNSGYKGRTVSVFWTPGPRGLLCAYHLVWHIWWTWLGSFSNLIILSSVWAREESEQLLLADLAISQKRETELDPGFLGKLLGSSTC